MRLFSSESQFKPFSVLTASDNLTSSNIQQLLRNLLFLFNLKSVQSTWAAHLFSDGKQAASSDSVDVLFVFDLWMLWKGSEVAFRWH